MQLDKLTYRGADDEVAIAQIEFVGSFVEHGDVRDIGSGGDIEVGLEGMGGHLHVEVDARVEVAVVYCAVVWHVCRPTVGVMSVVVVIVSTIDVDVAA